MQVTIVCGGDLIAQAPCVMAIGGRVLAVGEIDASNCDAGGLIDSPADPAVAHGGGR